MQMNYLQKDSKYLGIPMFLSKSKSRDFQYLSNKVQAQLVGQRKNALSWIGHFTMVTSVLQQILIFPISKLKILNQVCQKFDGMCRGFQWRVDPNKTYFICLKAWDMIYKPKFIRGLGFKLFKYINTTLLAKLAWNIAIELKALWVKCFQDKYVKRLNFLLINQSNGS